jgi:predicted MFS family arabinose efflux permease
VAVIRHRRQAGTQLRLGVFLTFLMAMGTFPAFALGAVAPFIIDDLEISRAQLGSVSTAMLVVAAVTAPVIGSVSDRLPTSRLSTGILVIGVVGLAGIALAPTVGWMIVAAAVYGIPCGSNLPLTNRILADLVPPGARGRLMGVKASGVQAAGLVSGLVMPTLALILGWRGALGVGAVVIASALPLARLTVRRSDGAPVARDADGPRPSGLITTLTVYAVAMGFAVSAVTTFLVLYGVEDLGLPEREAGLGAAVLGLAGIVSRVMWTDASERSGSAFLTLSLLPLGGVTGIALAWLAGSTSDALFWVGAAAFGATAVAWNAVGNLALVAAAGRSAGRASGIMQSGFFVGYATAPIAVGAVIDHTHRYEAGWAVVGASLVCASGWLALRWAVSSRAVT